MTIEEIIKDCIRPLPWGKIWFVVHVTGTFEFFTDEYAAENYGRNYGRRHCLYDEKAIGTYNKDLVKAKEAWQKTHEEYNIREVMYALDLEKLEKYMFHEL